MNTDELLTVIENGLKDVRAEILQRKHPDQVARKSLPPEVRLNDLEWTMSNVQSKLGYLTSQVKVFEMNIAKLKAAVAETAPAGKRRAAAATGSSKRKSADKRERAEGTLTTAASTKPSPESRRGTGLSRSRGRRV